MSSNDELDKILQNICEEEYVSFDLLQSLLKIEKEYQNKEKRFGIFEKIKDQIEKELDIK
jgi:hypothetical protein